MTGASRRAGELLRRSRGILILTGAGVSAESGIPVFRGEEGLWRSRRPEELATSEAFRRDPETVWAWYRWRRDRIRGARPNPAHSALARVVLERDDVTLVTQNVDGLHEEALRVEAGGAGIPDDRLPLRLHGSIFGVRCTRCDHRASRPRSAEEPPDAPLPRCPSCGSLLRPDVVWFGEGLPEVVIRDAFRAAGDAEVALVVGTSARVRPASDLPAATLGAGGAVVEVNPAPTPLTPRATVVLRASAGEVVPEVVEEALRG